MGGGEDEIVRIRAAARRLRSEIDRTDRPAPRAGSQMLVAGIAAMTFMGLSVAIAGMAGLDWRPDSLLAGLPALPDARGIVSDIFTLY